MLLSIFGIIAIAVLLALRIRGAILIGIVATGLLSVIFGVTAPPVAAIEYATEYFSDLHET